MALGFQIPAREWGCGWERDCDMDPASFGGFPLIFKIKIKVTTKPPKIPTLTKLF